MASETLDPKKAPWGELIRREREDGPCIWRTRGIGSEWGLTCLVTGRQERLMPNVSGFVPSRAMGERVVAMFGGRAFLDYRPSEPGWIQVKVGCTKEHEDVLGRLCNASGVMDGVFLVSQLMWALDPTGCPGYEPTGLRIMREEKERADKALAEVEKLRGENERLRENAVRLARTMASVSEEIGALQSEVHRG